MTQILEPLPCPFCGKKPDVRKALNGDFWIVVCANFGDGAMPPEDSGCAIMPRTAWYLEKEIAVSMWNKRMRTK